MTKPRPFASYCENKALKAFPAVMTWPVFSVAQVAVGHMKPDLRSGIKTAR
jgi:hypothetical protein